MQSGSEKPSAGFRTLGDILVDGAAIFLPPERLSVSEAAAKYRWLNNPPAYIGPWKNETTPYMVEPQDMFTSRYHNGLVFVGPAQSAKTESLVLNTLCYTVICDPADTILYSPSQASSRDFSKRRVDRMHRHSKPVGEQLIPGRHNDNTYDKNYRSGMIFSMSWPSINEMSGKPIPRTGLTDYDRMPMDVDGEGSPFDLAQKRTTSFKSFGMTMAESSPGKEITDAKWQRSTPHQAPPCEGILALYNRGDRRRWYWPCPHCREFFEGNFSDLIYEDKGDALESAKTVIMVCPKNGCVIKPESRFEMNRAGVWLREGETINVNGERGGKAVVSEMASFWLKGVAAAFITWQTLVMKYLNALEEYTRTGAEEALKATITTDQGEPYLPKSLESSRLPEDLKDQAVELPPRHIPPEVRALFAEVDVQKNAFVVQVHGIAEGQPYKIYVIDRFTILKSERRDEDGERKYVKPSDFPEDWDLIKTEVMDKTYPLSDLSGTMAINMTFCDSGGKSGTTTNAYDFYRRLKKDGNEHRFLLVKGDPKPNAPRAHIDYPDSGRKDRFAQARGEVPVLFLNSNILKDTLNGMLDRNESGDCRIIFPNWLGEKGSDQERFFDELTAEVRTQKGWENPLKRRNESWDLLYYHIGACVIRHVENVDWTAPPSWLAEWDDNPMVEREKPAKTTPIAEKEESNYGLAQLGELLG
jgi:phage terminase large subunit GpA-like protein